MQPPMGRPLDRLPVGMSGRHRRLLSLHHAMQVLEAEAPVNQQHHSQENAWHEDHQPEQESSAGGSAGCNAEQTLQSADDGKLKSTADTGKLQHQANAGGKCRHGGCPPGKLTDGSSQTAEDTPKDADIYNPKKEGTQN